MSQNFIAALETEIASLESALSQDERFIRLRELRRVLSLYRGDGDSASRKENGGPSSVLFAGHGFAGRTYAAENLAARRGGRQASPEREKALRAAATLISNSNGPVPTRDILEHLESIGITISGENPLNNLSALLSNSNKFVAQGRSGWVLKDEFASPSDSSPFTEICDIILADLETEQLRKIYEEISGHRGIPGDIDAMLLSQARRISGRDLDSEEKRSLRDTFKRRLDRVLIV